MKLSENHATIFALDRRRSPTYARLAFLMSRDYKFTKHEAAKQLRCGHATCHRALREIYEDGLSRIDSWVLSRTLWIPRYRWGKGVDAPKPEPQRR